MFGVWANVQSKPMMHLKVAFGPYECGLPTKQSSSQLILRSMWTSYDYLSEHHVQDDFVVGGIVDFQMFHYPEMCRGANKWVMRNVLETHDRLKPLPFPDTTINNVVESPVEVIFHLPEKVYTSDDATNVKIGVWDAENERWSTDYIGGELEFKRETR